MALLSAEDGADEEDRGLHPPRGIRPDPGRAARQGPALALDLRGKGLGSPEGGGRALPRLGADGQRATEAEARGCGRGQGQGFRRRGDPPPRSHRRGRRRQDLRASGRGGDSHPHRRGGRVGLAGARGIGAPGLGSSSAAASLGAVSDERISLSEASRRAGVSAGTLKRWADEKVLPVRKGRWTAAAAAQARVVARMRERGYSLEDLKSAGKEGRLAFGFTEELFSGSQET